jgi:hypothetical protein
MDLCFQKKPPHRSLRNKHPPPPPGPGQQRAAGARPASGMDLCFQKKPPHRSLRNKHPRPASGTDLCFQKKPPHRSLRNKHPSFVSPIDTRLPMSCTGVEMPEIGKNMTEARSALAEWTSEVSTSQQPRPLVRRAWTGSPGASNLMSTIGSRDSALAFSLNAARATLSQQRIAATQPMICATRPVVTRACWNASPGVLL